MRYQAGLTLTLLIAGCGSPQRQDVNEVDIGNAARAAQAYSDAAPPEAAQQPRAALKPLPEPSPTPSPTVAPAPDVVSEAPFTQHSAQGAANVVQTYFALIEAGKYRAAWQMWDRDGGASGMSAAAFAASFDKYREFHAEIGAPGRIDAGAGQRYVTVPVKAYGTLRSGAPFAMEGPVTLHRAGDIDGATAAQRRWRISESGLRPRPAAAPSAAPDRVSARYRCIDGSRIRVSFDNRRDTATLTIAKRTVILKGQRPASGIWYAGEGYDLRGKGDAATLTRAEEPPLPCTAIR